MKARNGDVLTVMFNGAKLSIAPYSTVELDGAIYQRQLKDGEDPEEVFAAVYEHLRTKCLAQAKRKLADFAAELAKSKRRPE